MTSLWHNVDVEPGERTIIFGDIHVPYQDKRALALAIEVGAEASCTRAILQGDTSDFYPLSKHEKDADLSATMGTMRREAEGTKALVDELSLHFEEIIVGAGNHEGKRWHNFITDNPGLRGYRWDYLLDGAYEGCTVLPWKYWLTLGDLALCHGDRLFTNGMPPARATDAVLAKYPTQNTMFGHTHRAQHTVHTIYKYGLPRNYGAWTIGNLYNPVLQDYLPDARHQLGFAIVDSFENGRFAVTQHLILQTGKTGKARACYSPLTRKVHK